MSNEQEQIDRERYNAEAEEAYRAEVEEDTPRMAERTDRQAQIDPLLEAFDAGQEAAGRGESVAANPYPAGDSWGVPLAHQYWHDGHLLMTAKALLWERDAQIASLTAQLAECYRLSGADPDGNEDWRLASEPPKKWIPTEGCTCSLCRAARLSPAPVSPVEPTPEPPTEAQWGEYDRLKRQAREIERALREAGCPAMPLEQGVRWLADKDFTAPLPPRPPAVVKPLRYDLVRYGVTWPCVAGEPLLTPMPDGYWTPWHLAVETPTEDEALQEIEALRALGNRLIAERRNDDVKVIAAVVGRFFRSRLKPTGAPAPCVWVADGEGYLRPGCTDAHLWGDYVETTEGWQCCPYCEAPLTVER